MADHFAPSPVGADEYHAFVAALREAFHSDLDEDEARLERPLFEPERTLAIRDGGRIVATAAVFSRELTVPGGPVPAAAVTLVGVHSTHRRRGLLKRMMARQLEDVRDRGEPVAALWASEGGIYGRFGYGPASSACSLRVRTPRATITTAATEAPARLSSPADAREALASVYERVRPARPGLLSRTADWWALRLHDPPGEREGASGLRAVVVDGPDGAPAGYAIYAVRIGWSDGAPDGEATVRETLAVTPEASRAVWRHLVGLDLVARLRWRLAAPDEPGPLAFTDPTAARRELWEGLWVRLVDVGPALAARTYAAPVDVVLEVADAFCPWNARRYRLAGDRDGATCEPTGDPPDLELSATELGAAYLGGTTLTALAAAGRVRERTPGALPATALAMRGAVEPWCPEIF